MIREEIIQKLTEKESFDFVIIGGGATGLGCALDACLRGYSVLLLEQYDFAKSTSSKSTKLVHGGVRYLEQGDLKVVLEALRERGRMLNNAPHLCYKQEFVLLTSTLFHKLYYYIGLKVYDLLSGKYRIGKTKWLSKTEVKQRLPHASDQKCKIGGISYIDGQFNDARLAIELAKHAVSNGGLLVNYARVEALTKDPQAKVNGLVFSDRIHGTSHAIKAKAIINATGVTADDLLNLNKVKSKKRITASKGSHIVVNESFLGSNALLVPKTKDGRVLYAINWEGKTIIGTTDELVKEKLITPVPSKEEIQFMIETFNEYSDKHITKSDITSVFSGLRPLVQSADNLDTKKISRSHVIFSTDGITSVMGGKWTTYRSMAEQTINESEKHHCLTHKPCLTANYSFLSDPIAFPYKQYGTDAYMLEVYQKEDPSLMIKIHDNYPFTMGMVKLAIEKEFAQKAEDVLARRTRLLFLDAKAAIEAAPIVIEYMSVYLNKDLNWKQTELDSFNELAQKYLPL